MTDPNVSLRRINIALQRLPPGYWPDHEHAASWSITDYLLAQVVDEIRQLAWITASINSKKKIERPKPIWRPSTSPHRPRTERAPRKANKSSWWDLAEALAPGSLRRMRANAQSESG